MTQEQIKFILKNSKLHDTDVYKFLLKQVNKNTDIDIIKMRIDDLIKKLLHDNSLLQEFTNGFNHKLLRKKLANYDSLDIEEKILISDVLKCLNPKHKYILLQVFNVGRSQSDVAQELKMNRNDISKIIQSSLDYIIKEVGEEL